MTENLKKMLSNAKTVEEAAGILNSRMDELSMEDQMKIYQMASDNYELNDNELDMVVGGNFFSDAFNTVKDWCSDHKFAVIVGACILAGACIFAAGTGALIVAGVATYSGTLASTLGGAALYGGIAGLAAGSFVAGVTGNGGNGSNGDGDSSDV